MITERTRPPVEIVGVTTLGDVSRAQLTRSGAPASSSGALPRALPARGRPGRAFPEGPADRARGGHRAGRGPPRDDPRDALVARDGASWPTCRRLQDRHGLAAPRRALLGLRADLRCVPIRGNAGTRLARSARASSTRWCWPARALARIGHIGASAGLEPDEDAPRPRPGRPGGPNAARTNIELAALLDVVTDEASVAAVTAERSLLEALEAGCTRPSAPTPREPPGCGCRRPS